MKKDNKISSVQNIPLAPEKVNENNLLINFPDIMRVIANSESSDQTETECRSPIATPPEESTVRVKTRTTKDLSMHRFHDLPQ